MDKIHFSACVFACSLCVIAGKNNNKRENVLLPGPFPYCKRIKNCLVWTFRFQVVPFEWDDIWRDVSCVGNFDLVENGDVHALLFRMLPF